MQAHELQGVLKKRSRRGIWQTRFFSTRGQYLQYARDSKSLVRKEINLSTFTHIFATTNQISFCCEGASWVLKAKSCEQADEWTKFLVQRHRDVLNDALEKNSYDLDAEGTVFCGNNEKMCDQDVTSKRREDDASRTNIVFALGDDEDDSSGEEDEEDPRRRASTDDEDPRSVEKLHSRRLHVVVVPSSNVTSSEKFQASPTNSSCRISSCDDALSPPGEDSFQLYPFEDVDENFSTLCFCDKIGRDLVDTLTPKKTKTDQKKKKKKRPLTLRPENDACNSP